MLLRAVAVRTQSSNSHPCRYVRQAQQSRGLLTPSRIHRSVTTRPSLPRSDLKVVGRSPLFHRRVHFPSRAPTVRILVVLAEDVHRHRRRLSPAGPSQPPAPPL
ncbi:hypothetical protein BJ546DRAFT_952060 [Cryomyces antarcticus]